MTSKAFAIDELLRCLLSWEYVVIFSLFYLNSRAPLTNLSHHFRERVLNATSGSLQELNVQGLQPGSAYEFRVVAHNQHGIGESSQPLRVSTATVLILGCELPL